MNAMSDSRPVNAWKRLSRNVKLSIVVTVVVALVAGGFFGVRALVQGPQTTVTAYFDSTKGIYVGDAVRVLGVQVGKISEITARPEGVKVVFSYESSVKVPQGAKAVIISPSLVTSRSLQLTPAYTGGASLQDGAVIPQDRTAVPVEWDDFRQQLEKLNTTLGPDAQGRTGLGDFLDTASANLEGQGPSINDAFQKLSQAVSTLGDKSTDIFSTIRNLQLFVSALVTSSDVLSRVNVNLAAATNELSNEPDEVSNAVNGLDGVITDLGQFLRDNNDRIAGTVSRATDLTTTLQQSRDDLEQTLHLAPTALQNFANIYQPAQDALTGALAFNNFANPITFICAGIQAASKMGAAESAKLCAQYLGPVLKNLAVNFPALGTNPVAGASVRPNEITYSEPRLRGAIPGTGPGPLAAGATTPSTGSTASASRPQSTTGDRRDGLLMPQEGGR